VSILFVMIPSTLALAGLMLWFLVWAVRSGQMEDVEGEKYRILFDDLERGGPR